MDQVQSSEQPVQTAPVPVYDIHALRNAKDFVMKMSGQVVAAEANDGKVSTAEAVQMLFMDVPDMIKLIRDGKEFGLEVKDLSMDELKEMAGWVPELISAVMAMLAKKGA
jgi:hypothetical protein